MNVPAIRAALLRLKAEHAIRHESDKSIAYMDALVRVGLRACDEAEKPCLEHDNYINCAWCSHDAGQMQLLADILREAGVEVEG